MNPTVLLVNLVTTWLMVGIVTYVQFVHYPMFRHWPRERFGEIEREHQRRTSWVVMPLMLAELTTTILLLLVNSTDDRVLVATGCLAFIWLLTFGMMVPLHERLAKSGFAEETHRALLNGNAVRSVAWWTRGLLVCWLIADPKIISL
ncbi:hypothetical protein BH11PLA2_BH11PLA2_42490 [soil metagenome]